MKQICLLLFGLLILGNVFGQEKSDDPVQEGFLKIKPTKVEPYIKPFYLITPTKQTFGFKNEKGELVIPYIFDYAWDITYGYFMVKMGQCYGTLDSKGNIMIPVKFKDLERLSTSEFMAKNVLEFYGIINSKGVEILPFHYDHFSILNDSLASVDSMNIHGIYNYRKHVWKYDLKYSSINSGNLFTKCTKSNGKIDWYNVFSDKLIDSSYSSINHFKNEYLLVEKNGMKGIVDKNNNSLVPVIYNELIRMDNRRNTSYGVNNTYAIAKMNNKYGVISFENTVLIDFMYDTIQSYYIENSYSGINTNLLAVKTNNTWGIFDFDSLKITTPIIYQELYIYNTDRILAKKDGKYGIISYNGNAQTGFIYSINIQNQFSIFVYKKENKYGILSDKFEFITPPIYDTIQPVYERYHNRNMSYCIAIKGGTKILFNRRGEMIDDVSKYDSVEPFEQDIFLTSKNNKFGLVKSNTEILKTEYDMIAHGYNYEHVVLKKGIYYILTFSADGKFNLTPIK